jgi:serine phosphatase RsbU (regulator of sigma subunit)/pSer/pThr/pTyr-binding forkhead associated (FHA) protein
VSRVPAAVTTLDRLAPVGRVPVPELLIQLPDGRQVRHVLSTRPQVAGRDPGCDIFIDDPSTSRRHARFSPTSDGYLVEDLGSRNGTLVNDAACTSRLLQADDVVTLGSVIIRFHDERAAGAERLTTVVVAEDEVGVSRATRYATRDQQLQLSRQRLQMIYDLGERLTTLRTLDELLNDAVRICREMLRFERCALGVKRRDRRAVDWPVVHNLRGAGGELTVSGSLLRRAMERGERAVFNGGSAQDLDPTVSIVQHGIRSAMCVPLLHGETVLGVIYGDRLSASVAYTQEDIDFLAAIAHQVSIGLVNAQLLEEQKQIARLHHDLDIARTIQTGLFPAALPARPGLEVAALNEPGNRVSGDYYDVMETPDGCCWMLIADVTGEGIPAALLMANLQAAVRVTIHQHDDPGVLLARWNPLIHVNTDSSKFITCLLIRLDPTGRRLHIASAGHHLPLILPAEADAPLSLPDVGGLPLGVTADAGYESAAVELGTDPCILLAYTDGVVEAMNTAQDCFGAERLVASFRAHRGLRPSGIVRQVRQDVTRFAADAPQSDDITLLAASVG